MVKKVLLIITMLASTAFSNVYEKNCISCHKDIPVTIDKYFYRYLLKYSSENSVKKAMFEYLKNPTKEKSVMAEAFLNRFGLKNPTTLSDEELQKALDEYWEEYKVFGKLK